MAHESRLELMVYIGMKTRGGSVYLLDKVFLPSPLVKTRPIFP